MSDNETTGAEDAQEPEWSWDDPVRMPDVKQKFDTILVAVDGSAGSEKALAYAALLAGMTKAKVLVVTAYNPPVTVRRRGILAVEAARVEMEEEAKEIAAEAAQLLLDRGLETRAIVVKGDPAQAIIETSGDDAADLVVMGRRGLSVLEGLMLGSVSERVARLASVPVFLA